MKRSRRSVQGFESNVFINCPFDPDYASLLRPLLFTVISLGFNPRIASERSDSVENRIDKIIGLIRESRFSIHDISRLRAKKVGEFARFNLPFELGLAHASRVFARARKQPKLCLVLERTRHDFRRALSDLGGSDIKGHGNKPAELVRCVRDWFVETVGLRRVRGATSLWYQFNEFASDFYDARKRDGFSRSDLNFMPVPEYIGFIQDWVSRDETKKRGSR